MKAHFKLKPKLDLTMGFYQDQDGGYTVWFEEIPLVTEADTPEVGIEKLCNMLCNIFKSEMEPAEIVNTEAVGWQLCPKCNGDGNLYRYNSPALICSTSAVCDICNGRKIISVVTGLPPTMFML